ncbi:MAG TPA: peptidoglycan DD-metalloendopeptidase family protein [Candidatus Limnocylindria bacterium]|nr:peptidoglycan DD-metalloendopeptidase family protein [Candidatus Limnocylindria bacterium]
MRGRSRLAVTLVALLTVGTMIVGSDPRNQALAADPVSQARTERASIEAELAAQRAKLDELRATSATLSRQLSDAEQELADATAEYERVIGLLQAVRADVNDITARLRDLRARIERMDRRLWVVAQGIAAQTTELEARETLLQDHLRSAYEQSQISILEIILHASNLDEATNQVSYLLTLSDQDKALADEIRQIREELLVKQGTLSEGRAALRVSRIAASEERHRLVERKAQLVELEQRAAKLKAAAEKKRAAQAAALNAALEAKGNVKQQIADNERAFEQANQLVHRLVAEQRAIEEARRLAEKAARDQANQLSALGFRWPEVGTRVTQEWGPTTFAMEPPYTYHGVYYPHFHGGLDMVAGCGSPILASKAGVVVASGQPLWPYDPGFGVVIDHGGGIQTWYWHITTQIVVRPGQVVNTGQIIGYEGTTGFSTGCHLHFATNVGGVWENPRAYLP